MYSLVAWLQSVQSGTIDRACGHKCDCFDDAASLLRHPECVQLERQGERENCGTCLTASDGSINACSGVATYFEARRERSQWLSNRHYEP